MKKPKKSVSEGDPVELVRRFSRFGPSYMKWIGRNLPDDGTSVARLRLLGVLGEHGAMSMRALTRELRVSPQNVSVMIEGLEAQGLVARRSDPRDRRVALVDLTLRGRERVEAGMASHRRAASTLFDCLTEVQRAQLAVCLDRLNAELERRLGLPA